MNSKVILVFFALVAYTCAAKVISVTFWDYSTRHLMVEATLTMTSADGLLHGAVSNLRFIRKAGVRPDRVYEPFKWTLAQPLEQVDFNLTYSPRGTFEVTSPEGTSASAQHFAYLMGQALAQATFIESFYSQGLRPQVQNVFSFSGLCEPRNATNTVSGTDVILSFNVNADNCSIKIPIAPKPHPENREKRSITFADGKTFKKTLLTLKYVDNCVTHNVGIGLILP